jgi:hypothetical protein
VPGVPLPPYGRRTVTVTFDPPVQLVAARPSMADPSAPSWSWTSGAADFRIAGLAHRSIAYSAALSAKRGDPITVGPFTTPFDPLVVEGSIDIAGEQLEYGLLLGPGLGVLRSYLPSSGAAASLTQTDIGLHALSVRPPHAPGAARLSARPRVVRAEVTVRNDDSRVEVIEDAATLDAFVSLEAASLGGAAAPTVRRVGHAKFPLVLRAHRTLTVRYAVTVAEANDAARGAGHEDFRLTATVTPAALDWSPRSPLLPPVQEPVRAETLLDVWTR